MRLRVFLITGFLAACTLVGGTYANASSTVTIVAVGDIAWKSTGGQGATAKLTKALKPNNVILMGDLAYSAKTATGYSAASISDFATKFLPTWGSVLTSYPTWAVPGNHEYNSSATTSPGYSNLLSSHPAMPKTGSDFWWVKNASSKWVVIGLDSEGLGSTTLSKKGKREVAFLKATLAANPNKFVIVTWHRPRYSKGEHGNQSDAGVTALWNAAKASSNVKIALWGHDHDYERVLRTATDGHTITTFTVGTGGAELRNCPGHTNSTVRPTSFVCGKTNNYGVLKLTLSPTSYTWNFLRTSTTATTGTKIDWGTRTVN
ncbi:MAG: metallophosphoesterase [Actinomycetes bacterium]